MTVSASLKLIKKIKSRIELERHDDNVVNSVKTDSLFPLTQKYYCLKNVNFSNQEVYYFYCFVTL